MQLLCDFPLIRRIEFNLTNKNMYKITRKTTEKGYTYMVESNDVLYSSRELAWKAAIENTMAQQVKVTKELHKTVLYYGKTKTVEVCIEGVCPQEEEEIRLWAYLSEKFGVRKTFDWGFIDTMPEWDIEEEKKSLIGDGDIALISNSYSSWHSLGETIYLLRLMDRYYLVNVQGYTPTRSAHKFSFIWCRLGEATAPNYSRTPYVRRAKYN